MASLFFEDGANIYGLTRQVERRMPGLIGPILVSIMTEELKRAIIPATPFQYGALRESEKVIGPFFERGLISAGVTAGDFDAPYAVFVHEDLDAHHKIGHAKFIEQPLRESAPFMTQRIAAKLGPAIQGGLKGDFSSSYGSMPDFGRPIVNWEPGMLGEE
jgi:hypothetical protein